MAEAEPHPYREHTQGESIVAAAGSEPRDTEAPARLVRPFRQDPRRDGEDGDHQLRCGCEHDHAAARGGDEAEGQVRGDEERAGEEDQTV